MRTHYDTGVGGDGAPVVRGPRFSAGVCREHRRYTHAVRRRQHTHTRAAGRRRRRRARAMAVESIAPYLSSAEGQSSTTLLSEDVVLFLIADRLQVRLCVCVCVCVSGVCRLYV